jgi:hypothetical protein
MDTLDHETVITLARHVGWPSVSIYMQTHPGHAESSQDQLRLKNLLKEAERLLESGGMRASEIDSLLIHGRETLDDGAFWRSGGKGIAAFFAEDVRWVFATRTEMPERVDVSDRFLIRPVLSALGTKDHYYVLALSQNRVRVFEGTRDELTELQAEGVPTSLADVLQYVDFEKNVQFHTRTPAVAAGKTRRAAGFHGHGGVADTSKANIEKYFRMIDRGMAELLQGEESPLIIAGVEYLTPIYRDVNSYPHLVSDSIPGNPDESSPHELGLAAAALLDPLRDAQIEADMHALEEAVGGGVASRKLAEIVPAAHEGRVSTLFVPPERSDWGSYDPSSGRVEISETQRPGDWDLTDLAAAETLLHGGTVHTTERESAASAIFRY